MWPIILSLSAFCNPKIWVLTLYTIYIQLLYMQTQTFNIALPVDLVTRMDLIARSEYRNRSEFIREAIRVYLDRADRWERIFAAGRKVAKKMGIKSEEDVNRIVLEYRHGKKRN